MLLLQVEGEELDVPGEEALAAQEAEGVSLLRAGGGARPAEHEGADVVRVVVHQVVRPQSGLQELRFATRAGLPSVHNNCYKPRYCRTMNMNISRLCSRLVSLYYKRRDTQLQSYNVELGSHVKHCTPHVNQEIAIEIPSTLQPVGQPSF